MTGDEFAEMDVGIVEVEVATLTEEGKNTVEEMILVERIVEVE